MTADLQVEHWPDRKLVEAFVPIARRVIRWADTCPSQQAELNHLWADRLITPGLYWRASQTFKPARGQSHRGSLLETCMSTAIGYVVAVSAQIVVFPWFGIHVHPATNAVIGIVFTVVSVVRGFAVRRLFNHLHVKGVL
jgi:hypothetical protein